MDCVRHGVPATFQLAYRSYVVDMQDAHDKQRGFIPIDRVILRQPLAEMIASLLRPNIDLCNEDKIALVIYHLSQAWC